MRAYKFLDADGLAPFTAFPWTPGEWVEASGAEPCRAGVHACAPADLSHWLAASLWEVELDGEIVEEATKVVASRARLVRRLDAWDDALRAAYTRDCADRAHELAHAADPPMTEWEAVIEPSVHEGPALLGFVAARIAEEAGGIEAYHAERARQAEWLAGRLGLV